MPSVQHRTPADLSVTPAFAAPLIATAYVSLLSPSSILDPAEATERLDPVAKVIPVVPKISPANVAVLLLAIVSAVANAFCPVPDAPGGETWKMIDPPAALPVPALPLIVKSAI